MIRKFFTSAALALLLMVSLLPRAHAETYVSLGKCSAGEPVSLFICEADPNALILGEGNPPLIIGMLAFAAIAALVRMRSGCDTRKGVRRSFLPLAFSFYAYSAHWWTDPQGTLAAAVEEMPAGYAEKVRPVVENIPMLLLMLALTVPVAILAIRLAEKALKKQAAKLK